MLVDQRRYPGWIRVSESKLLYPPPDCNLLSPFAFRLPDTLESHITFQTVQRKGQTFPPILILSYWCESQRGWNGSSCRAKTLQTRERKLRNIILRSEYGPVSPCAAWMKRLRVTWHAVKGDSLFFTMTMYVKFVFITFSRSFMKLFDLHFSVFEATYSVASASNITIFSKW